MSNPGSDPNRLARAIQIGLQFRDSGRRDVEAFLGEHEELRELLEPIVLGDQGEDVDESGADARSEPRGALACGQSFGPYQLERELGRGGMGTVYLASQPSLGRQVALKILTASTLLVSERALVRFQREARSLAALDHPNVVRILDTGVIGGMPFLAMELVRGASLAEVLAAMRRGGGLQAGGTLRAALLGAMAERTEASDSAPGDAAAAWRLPPDPIAAVVTLGAEVADALAHAHAHGLVHRDVKPSNLLLREDGGVLLIDFGVARPEDAETLTATGDLAGTPNYMAPEQACGGAVDGRTDVWALGVTLFEALTAQPPFSGRSPAEVVQRVLHADPLDPRRLNPAIGRDLAAVLLRSLAKEPAARYPSAVQFAEDLRAVLAGRPVQARLPGPIERLARWVRREPWRALAAALALAAAIVGVVVDQAHAAELRRENQRHSQALAEVNRMAVGVRLDRALAAAQPFHWPRVEQLPAIEDWQRTHCDPLRAELPTLADLLARLRAEALPYGEAEAEADRASHPEAEGLSRLEAELASIEAVPAEQRTPPHSARLTRLLRDRPGMQARVAARRSWRFAAAERQFLHDEVARAVARLQQLVGPDGLAAQVARRAARAAEVHRRCVDEAAELWRTVARDVAAEPKFAGLRLAPQHDLLPLGKDAKSGLWEFVHLPSGRPGAELPPRRDDGSLAPTDGCGIVFVLLPGGEFVLGAQATDANGPNFDPAAASIEGPVQTVRLAPFFAAKFELTRGQWGRLTEGEVVGPPTGVQPAGLAPAEGMPQQRALAVLADFGLALPTEAQWEYACRAGTTTPWHFGERALAARFANFAGKSSPPGAPHDADVDDDGHRHVIAPGSFAPNAFGLHDMHGNVAEWTCDPLATLAVRKQDGRASARSQFDEIRVVQRGGLNQSRLVECRASYRANLRNTAALPGSGVRAIRQVAP